jgi:hypothetical protein
MDQPKEKPLKETPLITICSYCAHYIWHPARSRPSYQEPPSEIAGWLCPEQGCSCRRHRDR